ncbi:YL1-domain-containing protein [Hesseltinella vesiculosa]|uniref:YL1-domain-containing protein n=1 Tax=Hesseltinella vesiculosa TaxID=101127 RepID=A0A1X2GIW9_9FUNG|nr:YL1-domain-containing protein [Hesseltinella vesiculosa]
MSFAVERERRSNAGSRMRALIDKETEMEDLFDLNESDDEAFTDLDEEGPDTVDSDFDMDASEGEQEQENLAAEEERLLRKEERVTKRAPLKHVATTTPAVKISPASGTSIEKPAKPKFKRKPKRETSEDYGGRQSLRTQTLLNRIQVQAQIRQDNERKARQPKRERRQVQHLTQEELLEEAKVTEEENKASLEQWQQLEEERQSRAKVKVKRVLQGPVVRYRSFVEGTERSGARKAILIADDDQGNNAATEVPDPAQLAAPFSQHSTVRLMQARNLITFFPDGAQDGQAPSAPPLPVTDGLSDRDLDQLDLIPTLRSWANRPVRPVKPTLCPITGKQAFYRDPVTNIPYHDAKAYAVLQDCLANKYTWSSSFAMYVRHELDAEGADRLPGAWHQLIQTTPTLPKPSPPSLKPRRGRKPKAV